MTIKRLTKRQQKLNEKSLIKNATLKTNLNLKEILPITSNQEKTFDQFYQGKNLFLIGAPGTGKTFLSLYLSLDDIFQNKSDIQKIVIIRSSQPSKMMGFLKGDEKQKMEVYETPYKMICSQLFGRDDAYEILKQKGLIVFESTSFLRGITIENSFVILDEVQNSTYMESKTVLSRIGENSRVFICGDANQDDLTSKRYNETSGFQVLNNVLNNMDSVSKIVFEKEDIVRSGFVKEFIISEFELGYNVQT